MRIHKMETRDCHDLLGRISFGRLACSRDDQPYIVPIDFVYEPPHLYGFATVGQKIEWMRTNPRVCVQADEILNHFQWSSVVAYGRYRELPDLPPFAEERSRAREQLARRSLWWQTAFASRRLKSNDDFIPPLFYCIDIDFITGYHAEPTAGESASSAPASLSRMAL